MKTPTERLAGSAVCLLSLGTYAYSPQTMEQLADWQKAIGLDLSFIVLDEFERVNAETIGSSVRPQEYFSQLIEKRQWPARIHTFRAAELTQSEAFQAQYSQLYSLYESDRTFHNLVRTHTFKSLHPRLHQLGIRNQRHPSVFELGRYVIFELALLAVLHREGAAGEVGFHQRSAAAHYIEEHLQIRLPPLSFLGDPQVPHLALEALLVKIPHSSRTVGPITAQVSAGRVLGVLGPNGSGKSTLLRALAGHLPIAAGLLSINGRNVVSASPFQRRIATVFQDAGLIGSLSAQNNIDLGRAVGERRTGQKKGRCDALAKAFELTPVLGTPAAQLSIGERQLVSLIRAVVTAPDVLLLDEPTASIDSSRRRMLVSVLREMVVEHRIPTIVVSHDADFLFQVADEILVLDLTGKVAAQGRAGDYVSGGSSFVAAELLGVHNVLKLTAVEGSEVVLDGWLSLKTLQGEMPQDARGVRIAAEAITVREAQPTPPLQTQGTVIIRGVIRSRQYFSHGDFIMFEPNQLGAEEARVGRARGFMLARAASSTLKRMHVDLVLQRSGITWLS